MPVSRGSVQHTLAEDLLASARSLLLPARSAVRASLDERHALSAATRERFGSSNAIAFPYARTALHAVLTAMQLPQGSKVLMTPVNVGPMLEVITSLGLQPEFVDIELETFGPDLEDLNRKLKDAPSAFLLTYLFGYVPEVSKIATACAVAEVRLIEDFSHNIGSSCDGRPIGTFGDAGIYSASMLKYVDGYNGAFVLTDDDPLGQRLESETERLKDPTPRRIRSCVLRTLVWNAALKRYIFSLGTYPALALLKTFSRRRFEDLLGPSISLELGVDELPAYYFEDIASIQIRMILRQLTELDELLKSRHEAAMTANGALLEVASTIGMLEESQPNHSNGSQTLWQFPVRVKDVPRARDNLFRKGIEAGTTNLMDLAEARGVVLPNTRALKSEHLFVPLHRHLRHSDYVKFFRALGNVD